MARAGQTRSTESQGWLRRHARTLLVVLAAVAVEVAGLRRRGYRFGGSVVASCSRGRLFTTIWIPAVSLKALRLGFYRVQRCPVGWHWSLVVPVDRAQLTDSELASARRSPDVRIP